VSTNYSAMTDTEFKAHWDAQYAQLARVNRRTWLYALPLVLCAAAVAGTLSFVELAPGWMCAVVGGIGGIVAAKAGRALAWRREGGKPGYLRRQRSKP
jgi:hypothetical protein